MAGSPARLRMIHTGEKRAAYTYSAFLKNAAVEKTERRFFCQCNGNIARPGVHLMGATATSLQNPISETRAVSRGPVIAAAVDNDYLRVRHRPSQVFEKRLDNCGLIQTGTMIERRWSNGVLSPLPPPSFTPRGSGSVTAREVKFT